MKIATFNVNEINGRLPILLRWLEESSPDIVCLQELKAPDDQFPIREIEKAGYAAIWHGQKSWNGVAILSRGKEPFETGRGLPGDPDDTHSRYIEAAVDGVLIGCLYLPNGNPAPGSKFDYKLRWFQRLSDPAAFLWTFQSPSFSLATSTSCRPTLTSTRPTAGGTTPCFGRGPRRVWESGRAGWTDALRRSFRISASTHSGNTFETRSLATPGCASTTFCSRQPSLTVSLRPGSIDQSGRGIAQAIMLPRG